MGPETLSDQHVGRIVRVRRRHFLVDEVHRCQSTRSTIARLSCIEPDDLGRPLEVVWERELDPEIPDEEPWDRLGGRDFDAPDRFAAYYHTLRWNRVTASRADLLQAPFRAGISIEHYQLEPLRMALGMPRVNLFIADGVGLGKTIEAGLIARELLIRRKVSDIVVCCPPSMLLQWREEMEGRFGLLFQVIDRAFVHRIRKERGYNVNPWATHNRFIISHNLIKDEEYAADLRAWLGRDLVRPRSLLILDEAHHAAPAAAGTYAITSQFTRCIKEFAAKFEHKVFMSATPHNGHSNSFRTLMAILDPQRFCSGLEVRARERDQVLIYRLKDDLRAIGSTFPERRVEPIAISAPVKGTPELELAAKLEAYCDLRELRLEGEPARVRNASAFLKSGLQQRLLSSVDAFWRTLSKHDRAIKDALQRRDELRAAAVADLDEQALAAIGGGQDADDLDDVEPDADPTTPTETEVSEAERQTEKATLATLGNPDHPGFLQEQARLAEMLAIADKARFRPDEKLKALFAYIDREMIAPGSARTWNEHRILVFTEYDDTLNFIRRHLEAHIAGSDRADDRLKVYRGETSLEERQEVQEAFNADPALNPVRILLATDAAREGLNLQKYCSDLFHFDIPWNPARLEQRNGRIDRKLQPSPVVHCRYFLYENRAEDTILRRIVEKTETIYRELGGFGTVLDKAVIQALRRKGIARDRVVEYTRMFDFPDPEADERAALARAEVSGEDDEAPEPGLPAREKADQRRVAKLRKSVERLRGIYEESRQWLDFRDAQFRAALDCSLRLRDIEGGLAPEAAERPRARRYRFPTESLERNPSWRETLNSLRGPRRRGEEYGAWLARCPIRPIVFESPEVIPTQELAGGESRVEPVHMHLEHRVSRRLLGRLQSQGFVYNDLSRACLTQTEGSLPLVYLIARLCLYGDGAARLHEDVIAVCAEWARPEIRKGGLVPVDPKRLDEAEFMRRLDDALLEGRSRPIAEVVRRDLLDSSRRDVEELRGPLEKKAAGLEGKIRKELAAAGAREAEAMRRMLEDQAARIEKTLQTWDAREEARRARDEAKRARLAPTLFEVAPVGGSTLDDRIRRERAAEKRDLLQRQALLPREIDEEPARILRRFDVRAVRLEPVGLVYLWPEKG